MTTEQWRQEHQKLQEKFKQLHEQMRQTPQLNQQHKEKTK